MLIFDIFFISNLEFFEPWVLGERRDDAVVAASITFMYLEGDCVH